MKNLWSEIPPIARAFLFLAIMIGAIFISGIAMVIMEGAQALDMSQISVHKLKLFTFLNQTIGFLLPAILLSHLIGNQRESGLLLNWPKVSTIILAVFGAFVALGIIGFVGEWNIELFNNDGEFFEFCRNMEAEAKESMDALLAMNNYGDLLVNILLIGLTPAICEEFAFRGALQSQFNQAFKNHHLAIWTAAIIFSFIHFQFLGFFPRMLLGAFFGYLVVYSGSLWPAILAHFINNTVGVITYYVAQNTDLITIEEAENASVEWYLALISLVLTIGIVFLVKKIEARKPESLNQGLGYD